MNGQFGYEQGGFQQPQQKKPFLKLNDGDNWIQLQSLQESEFTRQFPDNYGGVRDVTKVIRNVVSKGQEYAISLTKTTNQQLQNSIQAILSTGKNPLEFTYNIRRTRIGNMPFDVRYQVVTGEWVGLHIAASQGFQPQPQTEGISPYAYGQQPQNIPRGMPPIARGMPFASDTGSPAPPYPPQAFKPLNVPPQQYPAYNAPVQQQQPARQIPNVQPIVVLSEQEKQLLDNVEKMPQKFDKLEFINNWVDAMIRQFSLQSYDAERASIIFEQFYS